MSLPDKVNLPAPPPLDTAEPSWGPGPVSLLPVFSRCAPPTMSGARLSLLTGYESVSLWVPCHLCSDGCHMLPPPALAPRGHTNRPICFPSCSAFSFSFRFNKSGQTAALQRLSCHTAPTSDAVGLAASINSNSGNGVILFGQAFSRNKTV